jgi:hypothetical protein
MKHKRHVDTPVHAVAVQIQAIHHQVRQQDGRQVAPTHCRVEKEQKRDSYIKRRFTDDMQTGIVYSTKMGKFLRDPRTTLMNHVKINKQRNRFTSISQIRTPQLIINFN